MANQKLRKYELIYLVQPEASDEERTRVSDRVQQVIDQFEGKILEQEDWGKRKLAYEIRKFNKAYYTYLVLVGPPGMTQEIERILRMLDACIRFMTIKLEEGIDPAAAFIAPGEAEETKVEAGGEATGEVTEGSAVEEKSDTPAEPVVESQEEA